MFVAPWSPTSTLSMPDISTVPVLVTLKNIPNQLYSISGISRIASGLGAPIATSKPRLDPTLMGEAKILVEVELDKPFPHKSATSDKDGSLSMVDVEYSFSSKCGRCGHLGHKESRCLLPLPMPQVVQATTSGIHDSSLSKTEVAPATISPPGTEIATISTSNIEVASHFVSTPQIETTIATRNVYRLLTRSKEISSVEETSTTLVSKVLVHGSEPMSYCDVVAPSTNIHDVLLTTETTPLRIPNLSNVASSHVTSNTPALPSLDDKCVLQDNGAIITSETSDTDVDLVAPSS